MVMHIKFGFRSPNRVRSEVSDHDILSPADVPPIHGYKKRGEHLRILPLKDGNVTPWGASQQQLLR